MSLSPRLVQTRPGQPCSHSQSVPVPADGPVLAERPGQAGAHGATELQAPFLSLLGLAPSGGVQHSREGPQDTGGCRAGCVKDRQGHRAAQGHGTSRIFYFVHTVLSACGSCPTTPRAPQSCGAAGQRGSRHTVTPQLGKGAGELGGSPQQAWGSGLATPQSPQALPAAPPAPHTPHTLGTLSAGAARRWPCPRAG